MMSRPRVIACLAGLWLLSACTSESPGPGHWLEGSWSASAFSGHLHETWASKGQALLVKQGYYVENSDTLYAEEVRIDSLFGAVYLVAQPRGGDPVIFKMIRQTPRSMTFENPGNKNPSHILYESLDDDHFTRTTTGVEGGDTVVNRFAFARTSR